MTRPVCFSFAARAWRTKNVASTPPSSIRPPKYPPVAPAPNIRILIAPPQKLSVPRVRAPVYPDPAKLYTSMSDEAALPSQHAASLDVPQGWRVALNWTAAILISIVFLVAGLWKASDPIG